MNIAYIIHAYKLPNQLIRLVNTLASENAHFFIHVDKKVDIEPFYKHFENCLTKNIVWVTREYSNWGTINSVKAVLNALYIALDSDTSFEYFYCLSGQDYPIKPISFIEKYLEDNKDKDFIKYFPLPYKGWKGSGIHRYNRYHFIISKNRYIRRIVNLINFFLPRRTLPYNLKPFGGEFYLGLSKKSAVYIRDFIKYHPDYLPFFKYSYIPEEIFFQTILLNRSQDETKNIVNKVLTYVDWSKSHGPYPAILDASDMPPLTSSDCLFARKFDINTNSKILDLIDTRLLK